MLNDTDRGIQVMELGGADTLLGKRVCMAGSCDAP